MYIRSDTYEIEQSPSSICFAVDDLIAPAIAILNQKGYRTAFCCSGHADHPHDPELSYIAFEFGGITPEVLPAGWYWACDGQMEYQYETVTQASIASVMSGLTSWAESLPSAAG